VPVCAGVTVTIMRRSTVARLFDGMARLNLTISGMPTPTVWRSPRKLETRTSLSGFAIVVNEVVIVPTLPSVAVPLTVTVYFSPHWKALAGCQVLSSLSSVPSTSSPSASLTTTEVFSGSSDVYFTSVVATTSVASGSGWTTATVLGGGSGDGDPELPLPVPCEPFFHDGDLSPLQPALSRTVPATSAAATIRHGRRPARPVTRATCTLADRSPLVSMIPLTGRQSGAHLPL
jgi:hypothetical protein